MPEVKVQVKSAVRKLKESSLIARLFERKKR
jgi:hypothetical protein